jgi:uncharacterized membrane protein YdjX (TVP38/TMEM64 family)
MLKEKSKLSGYIKLSIFALLFLVMFLLVYLYWGKIYYYFVENPEELKEWILQWPEFAVLIFLAAQILQVVIFVIPGEVPQIAGGMLFGTMLGSLLSSLGIAIGSTINFFLARFLGAPFLENILKENDRKDLEKLSRSGSVKIVLFMLFLIPGMPLKDILCYISGFFPLSYFTFIFLSTLGRLPGIIGSALIGDAAVQKQWHIVIIISVIAIILFLAGFFYRKKIEKFLINLASKRKGKDDE